MAVVADIDSLDLVVAPHEFTREERESLRKAVEQRRDRQADAGFSERAAQLMAERRASPACENSRSRED